MMKKYGVQLAIVSVLLMTTAANGKQNDVDNLSKIYNGSVGLGGEVLFVFKSEYDLDKSMRDRVGDSHDRLRFVLNNPKLNPKDILVKPLGNYGAKIVANGQLIVPIGVQEASAHSATPLQLAKDWAFHLRRVLPKLTARPDLFARSYTRLLSHPVTRR